MDLKAGTHAASNAPDTSAGKLEAFQAYWHEIRGERAMPARRDLDPLDIPKLLANVFLVDVLADGDFRYRLVGDHIVERAGANFTGLKVSEVADEGSQPELRKLYAEVVAACEPQYRQLPYRMRYTRLRSHYEVIVAPFSADGVRVDMLFGIAVYPDDDTD
jgi:hypothetical protein